MPFNRNDLEVVWTETSVFSNLRQRRWAEFFLIMKAEGEVGPA